MSLWVINLVGVIYGGHRTGQSDLRGTGNLQRLPDSVIKNRNTRRKTRADREPGSVWELWDQ